MLNNSIVIILKYSFQIDNSWIPINTTTISYHQEFCTRFEDYEYLNLFHATFTIFNDSKYSNTPYLNPLKTIWMQDLKFLSIYKNFSKSLLFKIYCIQFSEKKKRLTISMIQLSKKFQNCYSLHRDTLDAYFITAN